MAVPPAYADLGKAAKDVFNKGYGFGMVKLDVKTKSANGVEFKTCGTSNMDSNKVSGNLETKYKWAEYGLTFTEKWNTDNTLGTEITVEDQITKGLKLTFDTTFSPNTGKKSGKVKSAYKREFVNVGCDVDFDFAGPAVHGTAVLGYEGWIAGYQMTFDSAKSKMTRSNFAIGYKTGDFQLHTNVNDGTEFGGSIYQKVSDDLETAVNLSWTAGNSSTRFGIAAKYMLDSSSSISAKVNNSSLVGIGYTQTLRPDDDLHTPLPFSDVQMLLLAVVVVLLSAFRLYPVETGSLVRCLESRSCCCLHRTSPETLTQTRMRRPERFPAEPHNHTLVYVNLCNKVLKLEMFCV
ncbi:Voltage-dependent anion-selective channel protein 2 [Anabarilius grahami]|uniref:Non-selective voltage-gated ion channel VDAC2 n=1 Tax=Anabarilius grahami TaxID=495550 RepID=A0A3N0XPH1_ANAGA|nr:Voltage-dependent anion-selective channel protein 2 [Anabarilius grahami]